MYTHNLRNNRYLVTGLGGGSGGFEEASGKGQDTPQQAGSEDFKKNQ